MNRMRALIRRSRPAAMLLVALALCLRALLPQGYMLAADAPLHLTVQRLFCVTGKKNGTAKSITFSQKSDKLCETVKIWSLFCKKLTFS